jgi:hypothetical protein
MEFHGENLKPLELREALKTRTKFSSRKKLPHAN